jgi:hypothetical protein
VRNSRGQTEAQYGRHPPLHLTCIGSKAQIDEARRLLYHENWWQARRTALVHAYDSSSALQNGSQSLLLACACSFSMPRLRSLETSTDLLTTSTCQIHSRSGSTRLSVTRQYVFSLAQKAVPRQQARVDGRSIETNKTRWCRY